MSRHLCNKADVKSACLLAVMVLLLALVDGCSRGQEAKTPPPAPVLTARAVLKNIPVRINPPPVGHVTPVLSVTVRPQIGGIISAVNFSEGQEVKKGDLLFTIDPRPAQAALTLAKGSLQRDLAQLENAKIQFDRDAQLFAQKLISQDVFDTSRAGMEALAGTVAADRADVTNAELNLQYTEIRSPVDGRTGSLQFHEGNVVKSPDDVLLTINQIHPIYVTFAVAERYLPEIQNEMRGGPLMVTARYENLTGEPPRGELTFLDNTVDPTTGTIQLKATFPNPSSRLWPGQFVQVELTLSELTNAVVVPAQALQTGQSGPYVYIVKADHTVEQRPVTLRFTVQNEAVIKAGVQAGETVVTDGQLRLIPGAKVEDKTEAAAKSP
jgi:multidrug efflux system membrane fusion protein